MRKSGVQTCRNDFTTDSVSSERSCVSTRTGTKNSVIVSATVGSGYVPAPSSAQPPQTDEKKSTSTNLSSPAAQPIASLIELNQVTITNSAVMHVKPTPRE